MAKHAQSVYRTGRRSPQWLKVKPQLTQEAVIAGFTEPRGSRKHFGALVLGVYEGDELVYIGHVGGGFGAGMLREIREKLDPLIRKKCPFRDEPETNTAVTWVKPELVCEVVFPGGPMTASCGSPFSCGCARIRPPARSCAKSPAGKG